MFKILFFVFLFSVLVAAQTLPKDTVARFRIGVELGSGYAYKLNNGNILKGNYTHGGMANTLRLKWGANRLASAGIETGWLPLSSLSTGMVETTVGASTIDATLSALPIMLIVELHPYNIQMLGGLGFYRVISTTTVFNSTITSSEWDFGYLLSFGYAHPISSIMKIGAEIKWNNISDLQMTLITIQAKMSVKLWEW